MILLTGAAGKTGRAVIRSLAGKGEALRALVHRRKQIQTVEAIGAQEVFVGDMRTLEDISQAIQGVRAVYHIPPNVSPEEELFGQNLIASARSAGVEHFVFHSVLHPQTEAMPHHWKKLQVEEKLLESGLPFTIIQPAAYMQNILTHWQKIIEDGIYPVPYPTETRLSMVDLHDVAQAAALVLTESGHEDATYELVGTEAMSQNEVAVILSQGLGRPVRAESVTIDVWERGARASGLGDYQVEALLKMFGYYERYGLSGNSLLLSCLLKRQATSYPAFVERTVRERKNEATT
ncbi:MAG: NmrA family NAD(P)-binding protein [Anaerolineales bacterium]